MMGARDGLAHGAKGVAFKAFDGLGSAIDWLAAKPTPKPPPPLAYQGPSPEDMGLLVMRACRHLELDEEALQRAADRLREGGYHQAARNYGSIRCLVAHPHGTDGRCIACQDAEGKSYFLRCFASDEHGLRQLLVVVRARTMAGSVAPLCKACQTRDAELREETWSSCRACRTEQARRAEQDPAFLAVRNAKEKLRLALHGKPWFRGIGIGSDDNGNATLEVRVSKLTPKVRRLIPEKVQDENRASIAVRVEAVGDIVALGQPTELGGYRSMEIHSKAPRAPDSTGAGVLDDLGASRGEELADWVGDAAESAQGVVRAENLVPEEDPRTVTEALEDKVHELAAAWAGLKQQMRDNPAVKQVLDPLHKKWERFWHAWQEGSTEGLEGVIADTNAALAGAEAEQAKYQLALLKAQAQTHNLAVQEAVQSPSREEPELQEYAKRWKAWVERLKEAIEQQESRVQWAKELLPFGEARRLTEVRGLQDEFNGFVREWDRLPMRIGLRKGEAQIKTLQEGIPALKKVKTGEASEAEKAAATKALEQKRQVEEAREKGGSTTVPDLPKSAATQAPAPPPPGPSTDPFAFLKPTTGKLIALGAAGLAALLITLKTLVRV